MGNSTRQGCRGYWFALQWIADHDEPAESAVSEIECLISVALVADLFGKTTGQVAAGVARRRTRDSRAAEQRNADKIDGYDRDDLGPSEDF